jgi:hypothetical protein
MEGTQTALMNRPDRHLEALICHPVGRLFFPGKKRENFVLALEGME